MAPARHKSGKKATPATKAPESAKKGKVAKPEARDGSKTAKILDLLKRLGGATSKELQKATGWQPHSVRGFLSGTVGKKMGLAVRSTKGEDPSVRVPSRPDTSREPLSRQDSSWRLFSFGLSHQCPQVPTPPLMAVH